MATDLLEQHRELDRSEPHAALGLRDRDAEPALVHHRAARGPGPSAPAVSATAADPGRRGEVVEERTGAVAERELVLGEVEVHRRRTLSDPSLTPLPPMARGFGRFEVPETKEPAVQDEKPAYFRHGDTEIELPIVRGTENELGADISKLRAQTGFITLDYGYMNTGACESAITYIDGDAGILRYRGVPDRAARRARRTRRTSRRRTS